MPNESAHIAAANRNQDTIDHLLLDRSKFSCWIATIALYKALHLVEAVFHADQGIHSRGHDKRDDILRKTHKYQHIYKNYAPLMRASKVARYLEAGNVEHPVFDAWMSPDDVVADLLNNRLRQIEKSACRFLKNPGGLRPWTA
jgi:hypothetical protein